MLNAIKGKIMYILMGFCAFFLVTTILVGIAWQDTQETLHRTEEQVKELVESQKVLEDKIEDERKRHRQLSDERKQIQAQFQEAQQEIERLRKLKADVVKNPQAAEEEMQKAATSVLKEIECLTGNSASCAQ